jgi:hypothetical protein
MHFLNIGLALAGTLAATFHAAVAELSSLHVSGNTVNTDNALIECGWYLKIEEEGTMPLYANGHYENLELFTHMVGIQVEKCGICMTFRYAIAHPGALLLRERNFP